VTIGERALTNASRIPLYLPLILTARPLRPLSLVGRSVISMNPRRSLDAKLSKFAATFPNSKWIICRWLIVFAFVPRTVSITRARCWRDRRGESELIGTLETKSFDDSRKSPTIRQSSSFPFITTYLATYLYLADIVAARRSTFRRSSRARTSKCFLLCREEQIIL